MRRFLSSRQRLMLLLYGLVVLVGLLALAFFPLDSFSKWVVVGLVAGQFLFFLCWFGAHYRHLHHPIQQIEGVLDATLHDETPKTFLLQKVPIYNSLGSKVNDVRDKVSELQQSLKKQKQLQTLLESSSIGVLLLDAGKKVILASQAMKDYVGQTVEIGQVFLVQNREANLQDLIEQVYQTGQVTAVELDFYSSKERTVKVECYPYIENDRIEACLFLLTDVSYLHQLEATRDNLVVNVSHELRTPITSIKGFTETLLDGGLEDRETARHFLEIIQQESNRLEWLVNDVLNLARLEQATTTLQMEEVNIASLVEGICRSFSQKIEAKRISFEMAIPPQFLYQTDAMQFQQVVSNLLSNAIRYTDAEGTIRISLQEDSEQWWLAVQDTGIGISEQHLDKIFDRFYRVNKGRARKQGGTGLGLAIVKEAVQALGATISVESQLGKGSTFTITFQK